MSEQSEKIEFIKEHIKSYPDFPKKGVLFRDIFSALREPKALNDLKDVLIHTSKQLQPPVDFVVGLDSRGFIFAPLIALELNIPFVPIRKKGKLPGEVHSVSYSLEYGQDTLQLQVGSIEAGKRVLIVDDLLATGGSLRASCELIEKCGAVVAACLVIMELEELAGRKKVPSNVISMIKY